MVTYSSHELIALPEFSKKFTSYLFWLKSNTIEKLAILKNNHIEAVLISKERYEIMAKALEMQQKINSELLKEFRNLSKHKSEVDKNIDIVSLDKEMNNDIF